MNMDVDRLKSLLSNPRILFLVFIFLIIPVVLLLLSLFRPTSQIPRPKAIPTPTLIPLNIPPDEKIPVPIIQVPPNVLVNRLGEVSFQINDLSYPDQVKLYQATTTRIEPSQADKIAKSLLFKSAPDKRITQTDTILFWKDGQRTLTIYLETGNIEYFNPQDRNFSPLNSSQEAMIASKDFIKVFSPYSNGLDPVPQDITYFISGPGDLKKADTFERADTIDVPFVQKINGLPIYGQFAGSRAHVWINKENGIIKASLKAPEALIAEGTAQIISLEQAKRKVSEGEGTIVLYGEDYHSSALSPPTITNLSSVKLGYFKNIATDLLYPIFVFSGLATTGEAQEKIVVYLPAVK